MTRINASHRCALLFASLTLIGAYSHSAIADGVTFKSVYDPTPASILKDPHFMSVEQFTEKAREGEKKGVYGNGKPIKLAFLPGGHEPSGPHQHGQYLQGKLQEVL